MSYANTHTHRLPWLDIAKAVAMIAVVFSHEFASVSPLVMLCNSFMLPLFFMCSGYCLSPGKYGSAEYLSRKAKTLLLPYFALGTIVSLLSVATNGIDAVLVNIGDALFSWQTLWFLPVLFVADIILYLVLSKAKDTVRTNAIVGILALVLGVVLCWCNITLRLDMEVVPIAVFYLSVGYGLKGIMKAKTIPLHGKLGVALLVCGLILMVVTGGNLIVKLNDILPVYKLIFSTMESVGLMLMLSTMITPPYCRGYEALCGCWSTSGRIPWLSLRSTCPSSAIARHS